MKACPQCGRLFPDDGMFCPVDGDPLRTASQVPAAQATSDPRIGRVLCERYQIRRVVADGGMGRVYEALDVKGRRSVAVKVLHPEVATNEVTLARFKREFDVSAELPHDHIVEVLEFAPTGDDSYAIVMEFLYGEELRATLKRSSVLPPGRLVRMLSQLARGLDQAHARRLVHRDLKPDNIFLCQTPDGDIVKILDFGSVRDNAEAAARLTVLGTTIGSPFYMAPEQAQALDSLDHRADVWALGAILYECLTGHVAFTGNNGPSILLAILTSEPAPASQRAAGKPYPVPEAVDRVLERALKKNPAFRLESVGRFADAFGAAYGLEGNHEDWAGTPEEKLQRKIDLKLTELLAAVPPSVLAVTPEGPNSSAPESAPASSPVSDRLGEFEPGELDSSLPPALRPSTGGPSTAPPRQGTSLVVTVVVALLALVLGVAATLWLAP